MRSKKPLTLFHLRFSDLDGSGGALLRKATGVMDIIRTALMYLMAERTKQNSDHGAGNSVSFFLVLFWLRAEDIILLVVLLAKVWCGKAAQSARVLAQIKVVFHHRPPKAQHSSKKKVESRSFGLDLLTL